jgi:hypothetical protein
VFIPKQLILGTLATFALSAFVVLSFWHVIRTHVPNDTLSRAGLILNGVMMATIIAVIAALPPSFFSVSVVANCIFFGAIFFLAIVCRYVLQEKHIDGRLGEVEEAAAQLAAKPLFAVLAYCISWMTIAAVADLPVLGQSAGLIAIPATIAAGYLVIAGGIAGRMALAGLFFTTLISWTLGAAAIMILLCIGPAIVIDGIGTFKITLFGALYGLACSTSAFLLIRRLRVALSFRVSSVMMMLASAAVFFSLDSRSPSAKFLLGVWLILPVLHLPIVAGSLMADRGLPLRFHLPVLGACLPFLIFGITSTTVVAYAVISALWLVVVAGALAARQDSAWPEKRQATTAFQP